MTNPYETDRLVQEYLLFHYGDASEIMPWAGGPVSALDFAVRAVSENLLVDRLSQHNRRTALDLGCAVGRSSFELVKTHHEVIGIDYSHAFVAAARDIAEKGWKDFTYTDEGDIRRHSRALRPGGVDKQRLRFEQGDAMNLRGDLGVFDTVLAANLLCRLSEPRKLLERLPRLVAAGGQLIITSPYTWLEEYTPRENWLGGYSGPEGEVRSLEALRAALEPDFELVATRDLPFLIREHARKFQWSVSQASVWLRR